MNWRELMRADLLAMLIPISGILVGGAIAVVSMILKSKERIAMIQQGMDPDAPKGKRWGAAPGPVIPGPVIPGRSETDQRMDC